MRRVSRKYAVLALAGCGATSGADPSDAGESSGGELEEAAFLDGCGHGRTFLRVMLPVVKAPMATCAILVFTLTWSEFLWPQLILRSPDDFTISIGLQYFMSALTVNWHNIAAVAVLASVPTVGVFLLLQRYFFSGTLTGATKG